MEPGKKRLDFLDSIRGIAALIVLISHVFGAFYWPKPVIHFFEKPFLFILIEGKSAVAMFFVLSGFVLSRPYVHTRFLGENSLPSRKIRLLPFYLRRILRIWPPWFAVFLASIFARHFLFHPPATQPSATDWLLKLWSVPLTAKSFFLQCVFREHDAAKQLLNQDWSLGVELKGSALIPLFVLLSRPRRLWMLIVLAALFPIIIATGEYYTSFIIGVCVARFGDELSLFWNGLKGAGKAAFFMAGIGLYQGIGLLQGHGDVLHDAFKYGWTLTSLGCGILITASLESRFLQRQLSLSPLVFLGRISYSLYLVQFIVILCLLPEAMAWMNRLGITSPLWLMPLTYVFALFGTVALAELVYRFVEMPTIRWGRRISNRLGERTNVSG